MPIKNQIIETNQNSKFALTKSKSLLDIANKLLSKKEINTLVKNFSFIPFFSDGHTYKVHSALISSDDKYIVSYDFNYIKIWDIETAECIKEFEVKRENITAAGISSDNKTIISVNLDSIIKIWDVKTGTFIKTLESDIDAGHVESISITANHRKIICKHSSGEIKILDFDTGENIITIGNNLNRNFGISPNERTIISIDNTYYIDYIKTFDIETGECIKTFKVQEDHIAAIGISQDGKTIISDNAETIKIWDVETGACIKTLVRDENNLNIGYVASISITTDRKIIVSAEDNIIQLWDVATCTCIKTLEGHSSSKNSVLIGPENKIVISGIYDNTIKIWDMKSGEYIHEFKGHQEMSSIDRPGLISQTETVRYIGKIIIMVKKDYGIYRTDPETKLVEISNFLAHRENIKIWHTDIEKNLKAIEDAIEDANVSSSTSMAITPDGKTIASIGYKTIQIWDIENGKCVKTNELHSGKVRSVTIAPDGKQIISGNDTIKIWDTRSGECLKTLKGHTSKIYLVGISPDSETIVSVCEDGNIKIWDSSSGECLKTLKGHSYDVDTIFITNDRKTIFIGGDESLIKAWDAFNEKCIYTIYNLNDGNYVAISPDGYFYANKEAIDKYLRIQDSPMSARKLTSEEVEHFYRKNLLKELL